MATYYIKQKAISLLGHFTIKDDTGADCYTVDGLWALMKDLRLKDMNDVELAQIKGKFAWRLTYEIYQDGVLNATVRQEFAFLKTKLSVDGPNWEITGNWMSSEFDIADMDGGVHAHISRELWSWGDSYRIDIEPGEPEVLLLCVVIAIDAVLEARAAAAAG